jgi:hypothetical protein
MTTFPHPLSQNTHPLAKVFGSELVTRISWRAVAAFAVPFLVYLLTMAPTIYNLDSAELTTAAHTGGIVRATGYPLYLMIGRIWSQIPIGDVGFRMNLLSAVSGAATVFMVERILSRWRLSNWALLGALGLLAFSTFFWAMSLIAEVYTLHAFLMTVVIWLLLRWGDQPTPARLAMVGLVMGLSAGHHAATVLLAPACVFYVLTVAPRQALQPKAILLTVGALVLGLSSYLYLPYLLSFNPQFNYAATYNAAGELVPVNLHTPDGLWWLISGKAFAGSMMGYTPAEFWQESVAYGVHLWRAFFAIGITPGLIGIVLLFRRNWRVGGMLALMFLANAIFYTNYRVIDKETMFLPTYVVWAIWLAVGLQWLLDWVQDHPEAALRAWGYRVVCIAIVCAVGGSLLVNWSQVDLRNDYSTRLRGEWILKEVPRNAVVFGWWETVPVVQYLQMVEGERPDVLAINRFLIGYDEMESFVEANRGKRPLFFDTIPAGLDQQYRFEKDGLLYRLR